MIQEVILPALGETMDEGKIVRWLKGEGDPVSQGDPIFEIETDKATIEVEATAAGVLRSILVGEGESVPIGRTVAYLADDMEEPLPQAPKGESPTSSPSAEATAGSLPPRHQGRSRKRQRVIASPRARRLADQEGIDVSSIEVGTGPKGRIVEADVKAFLERDTRPAVAPEPPAATRAAQPADVERVLPLEGSRKAIAERMSRSAQEAPHFYLTRTVDMSRAEEARAELNGRAEEEGTRKISTTAFLLFVCARALRRNPRINATLREDGVHLLREIHLGVAVDREEGLIVPVLRDADQKGLQTIAAELEELIKRARAGTLKASQAGGSTFTLTNLGMLGVDQFTAVINPPESAILAVGRTRRTVVPAEDEGIEIAPMMQMTLSCDHRTIDGAIGARFLQDVVEMLEQPTLLLR